MAAKSFEKPYYNSFDPPCQWEGDGDGENWNHFGDSDDEELENSSNAECFQHCVTKSADVRNWAALVDEQPFPSWEARADAAFEAAIGDHSLQEGCLLVEDTRSSIFDQDFPPLVPTFPHSVSKNQLVSVGESSPSSSPSMSSGSKQASSLDLDECQWQLLLEDQKKGKEEAITISAAAKATSVAQPHSAQHDREDKQWKNSFAFCRQIFVAYFPALL
ncbi:hypothetical protein LguiA_016924 [Lonicera macranthoides]